MEEKFVRPQDGSLPRELTVKAFEKLGYPRKLASDFIRDFKEINPKNIGVKIIRLAQIARTQSPALRLDDFTERAAELIGTSTNYVAQQIDSLSGSGVFERYMTVPPFTLIPRFPDSPEWDKSIKAISKMGLNEIDQALTMRDIYLYDDLDTRTGNMSSRLAAKLADEMKQKGLSEPDPFFLKQPYSDAVQDLVPRSPEIDSQPTLKSLSQLSDAFQQQSLSSKQGFEYGQKFVSSRTGSIGSLVSANEQDAVFETLSGKRTTLPISAIESNQVKPPATLTDLKRGDGLIANKSDLRYTVMETKGDSVKLRGEDGTIKTTTKAKVPQLFKPNPLGFGTFPAITSGLLGTTGIIGGATAGKLLAKSLGANEDQQNIAAGVGGAIGGLTGVTTGYIGDGATMPTSFQDMAKRVMGVKSNSELGMAEQLSIFDPPKRKSGLLYLPNYLSITDQKDLLNDLRTVVRQSPLFTPTMSSGAPFRYKMTNIGDLGWNSDRQGYRYESKHPVTGQPYPEIPSSLRSMIDDLSGKFGEKIRPDAVLLNWYPDGAKLGLHVDNTEKVSKPVVSLSLGDRGVFAIDTTGSRDRSTAMRNLERINVNSGDAIVFGGDLRNAYHAVERIDAGTAPPELGLKNSGRINLTARQVNETGTKYMASNKKIADGSISTTVSESAAKPPKLTSDIIADYLERMGGQATLVKPDGSQYNPNRKGRVNIGDRMTTAEKFGQAADVGLSNEFQKLPEVHARFDDRQVALQVQKELATGRLTTQKFFESPDKAIADQAAEEIRRSDGLLGRGESVEVRKLGKAYEVVAVKQYQPVPSRGNSAVRSYGLDNDPEGRFVAFNKPEEAYAAPKSLKELQAEARRLEASGTQALAPDTRAEFKPQAQSNWEKLELPARSPMTEQLLQVAPEPRAIAAQTLDTPSDAWKLPQAKEPKLPHFYAQMASGDNPLGTGSTVQSEYDRAKSAYQGYQRFGYAPPDVEFPKLRELTKLAESEGVKGDDALKAYIKGKQNAPLIEAGVLPKPELPMTARLGQQYISPKSDKVGTVESVGKKGVKLNVDGQAVPVEYQTLEKLKYTGNKGYGFAAPAALRPVIGGFVGGTAGSALFKQLAKSAGLTEEQQNQAAATGGIIGSFGGSALTNASANTKLRVPTAKEFAQTMVSTPQQRGAGARLFDLATDESAIFSKADRANILNNRLPQYDIKPVLSEAAVIAVDMATPSPYGVATVPALRTATELWQQNFDDVTEKGIAGLVNRRNVDQTIAKTKSLKDLTYQSLTAIAKGVGLPFPMTEQIVGDVVDRVPSGQQLMDMAKRFGFGTFDTRSGISSGGFEKPKLKHNFPKLASEVEDSVNKSIALEQAKANRKGLSLADHLRDTYDVTPDEFSRNQRAMWRDIVAKDNDISFTQYDRLMTSAEADPEFARSEYLEQKGRGQPPKQIGLFDAPDDGKFPLKKIISGGQTGADQVGLEVAKKFGIDTGGFAPPRFMTEAGQNMALRDDYGLTDIKSFGNVSAEMAQRTRQNARAADGTVIFTEDINSKGTQRTIKEVGSRPLLVNPESPQQLRDFIQENRIATLNVAGNRASKASKDFPDRVRNTLTDAIAPVLPTVDESLKGRTLITGKGNIVQYEGDKKFQLPDLSIRQVTDDQISRMRIRKWGDLGFTKYPALTASLFGSAGIVGGATLGKLLARQFGANEDQQNIAAGIGGVIGGLTGSSTGLIGQKLSMPKSFREIASRVLLPSRNSQAGAVYTIGGSRKLAEAPEIVNDVLRKAVAGDKTPYFVLGDAKGGDAIAKQFAIDNDIPYRVMAADKAELGNLRYIVRDYEVPIAAKQIAATGAYGSEIKGVYISADDSKGTQHMINAVMESGISAELTRVKSNIPAIPSISDPNLSASDRKLLDDYIASGKDPSNLTAKDFGKGAKPELQILGTAPATIDEKIVQQKGRGVDVLGIASQYQIPQSELDAMTRRSQATPRQSTGAIYEPPASTQPRSLTELRQQAADFNQRYESGQIPKQAYTGKFAPIEKLTIEQSAASMGMTLREYRDFQERAYRDFAPKEMPTGGSKKLPKTVKAESIVIDKQTGDRIDMDAYRKASKEWRQSTAAETAPLREAYDQAVKSGDKELQKAALEAIAETEARLPKAPMRSDFATDKPAAPKKSSGGFNRPAQSIQGQSTFIAESAVEAAAQASGATTGQVKAQIASQRAAGQAPDLDRATEAAKSQPRSLKQMQQAASKAVSAPITGRIGRVGDLGIKAFDYGSDITQAAQTFSESANRGESGNVAALRAAASVGSAYGVAALANMLPIPAPARLALTVGGSIAAAVGGDKAIDSMVGRDAAREEKYGKDLSKLGLAGDPESELLQPFGKAGDRDYARAYGNALVNTATLNMSSAAPALGRSLANLANSQSIDNARYASERGQSIDLSQQVGAGRRQMTGPTSTVYRDRGDGVTEAIGRRRAFSNTESRVLALQNLANESGYEVPRTGKFDPKLSEALEKLGYSDRQIGDYIQGRSKTIGSPAAKQSNQQQAKQQFALRSKLGKVTSSQMSEALSAERKARGLKGDQKLDQGTVDSVFSSLAGRSLSQMQGKPSFANKTFAKAGFGMK